MRGNSPMKMAVAATAIALFAAGCNSTAPTTPSGPKGGSLRIYATEPASLLPGEGNDSPSIAVLRQVYAGLVQFDAKTGAVQNLIADSIESPDNITWTVKLKKGFKFDNGEDVTSDSFIDSWNWTSYGPNAAVNSNFFSHIVGYADLQAPSKDVQPKAKTMSGLKKVDDSSFTVQLDSAFVGFPATLGYPGFFPVAKACLADTKACKEKPIGNGRYKIDDKWKHNVEVKVVRSDSWKGGDAGKAAELIYRIYDKNTTGYADFQAGELDIFDNVPPAQYKDAVAQYKDSLFEKPSNSFTYVGFPLYDPRFQDVRIRQAISLAVDRQAIIDKIFFGRFSVAEGYVSPNFDGARKGACNYCKLDVAQAKALLAAAGGWKGGKLTLWANAGAGHEDWLAVFGDQMKANLGIDYEINATLQFPQYLQTATDKKFTGLFRLGWSPDYPVLETYLAPLYGKGGSSNNCGYNNPEFDSLVLKGNGAKTLAEGIKFYQQAEDLVIKDVPVVALWFGKVTILYSKNVKGISYNTITGIEYQNTEPK